jgi:transposase InsO family protein
MLIVTEPKKITKKQLSVAQKREIADAIERSAPMFKRGLIRQFAASCGVGESTVYEWWLKSRSGELTLRTFEDSAVEHLEDILVALYANKGNVLQTWKECVEAGLWDRSCRQFHRFLQKEVDRMIRLAASEDALAARLLGQYVAYTVPHRDFEWQIDLVDLCVQVDIGRGTTAHGWAVVIIDKRTGLVRGWCLTAGQPTAGAVAAALAMAIRVRTEVLESGNGDVEVEVGGAPVLLRSDNGTQLLADLVTTLLAEVGTVVQPTAEYDPTAKGAIERFNRDAKRFSINVFGTTRGPKTLRGKELFRDPSLVLSPDELELLFQQMVVEHDRTPKRGETLSPLEQYAADSRVTTRVPESVLAKFHLNRVSEAAKIERGQVRFRNQRWLAPEIPELRGNTLEIWVSDIDPNYVEGRAEGLRFVLLPSTEIDDDTREDVIEGRGERIQIASQLKKAGAEHSKKSTAAAVGRDNADGEDIAGPTDVTPSTTNDAIAVLNSTVRNREAAE